MWMHAVVSTGLDDTCEYHGVPSDEVHVCVYTKLLETADSGNWKEAL